MSSFIRHSLAIAMKDIRLELRTKETFPSTFIFALLTLVIFNFALDLNKIDATSAAGGVLWVSIIFSATLALNRSFENEKTHGCLDGILLSPVAPESVYLGKFLANMAFALMMESIIVPVFIVLYNVNIMEQFVMQSAVIILGTAGFVAAGTLLAALSMNLRLREVMLPLLLFPIIVPVVIAAVKATGLLIVPQADQQELWTWVKILVAFDVIFFVTSLLVFEHVLED